MRLFILISACVLSICPALAQQAFVGETSGIAYASGGIGLEAREALRAEQAKYNLMVILSRHDGHYLGGGAITVRNESGKSVLEVAAQGPWFFAKLPPGHYTVEVRAGDSARSSSVVIGSKGLRRVHLTWDKEVS